jgi:hypothetical protein
VLVFWRSRLGTGAKCVVRRGEVWEQRSQESVDFPMGRVTVEEAVLRFPRCAVFLGAVLERWRFEFRVGV